MNEYLEPQNRQAQVEAARSKAQRFEQQVQESFAALASRPDGLLFLRWLVDQSGILKSQFHDDQAKASFYEGRRSIGAKLLSMAAQSGKLPAIMEGNDNAD